MRCARVRGALWRVVLVLMLVGPVLERGVEAQQFNSDNYLSMPWGTGTFLVTHGQRNSTILSSFALFPKWEFFVGANLFWKYKVPDRLEHFSTTTYAKYMFVENAAKNGGFAVMGGVGGNPGYYERGELTNSFKTYWASAPWTLPFAKGVVLLDLMPGFSVDLERGSDSTTAWSFTHSTRVAVYRIVPKSALVGEIYGSNGHGVSQAEYKAGVRWEPNSSFALAVTYSDAVHGSGGAGFEAGFMLFTPRFLCKGGCPQ